MRRTIMKIPVSCPVFLFYLLTHRTGHKYKYEEEQIVLPCKARRECYEKCKMWAYEPKEDQ